MSFVKDSSRRFYDLVTQIVFSVGYNMHADTMTREIYPEDKEFMAFELV